MFDFSQFSTAGGLRVAYAGGLRGWLTTGQAVIKNSPMHVAVTADAIIKPTPIETAKAKIIANLLTFICLARNRIFQNCPDIKSQK